MGLIIYLALGYWATGQTIYRNRILFGTWQSIFFQRIAAALIFGWILLPIAIIKLLIKH